MTTPRRRILRTQAAANARMPDRRELDRLLACLEEDHAVLARRTSRLKRAFHAFEKQQARIVRLERRLAKAPR